MSNNAMMNYKPGLTMDTPVDITMAAADWAILMNWFSTVEATAVNHIVYGVIAPQVGEAIFTAASIKGAQAAHEEHSRMPDLGGMIGNVQMSFRAAGPTLDDLIEPGPVDLTEVWIIRCGACGSSDEYPGGYDGVLTCGHNVGRTVDEKRPLREE